jgi:hypothetical protein
MGARVLLDIYLFWLGYIARLSGEEGDIYMFKLFLPPFAAPRGNEGVQHPVVS